ncbi:helix-turn-helix domain-containing protein [Actinosynnema sp. NPDC059335]|uniref:helix-turn-helix domain-containing protein n=1 Tax=Actinosynnema sp. NPDC059335 TaxID=3346804 RepID=UPI00366F0BEF
MIEEIVNVEEKRPPVRSSSAHSRELGAELRLARRRTGMSSGQTAEAMEWSLGKLSKLETGSRGTSVVDIATLLGRYGTDRATRERIVAVAAESDTGSFLRRHDGAPDELVALSVHESIARTVTAYEPVVVPALLQTEDYALALTGSAETAQARMRRQRQMRRPESTFYVHEVALQLPVGTPQVMHEQMLHLILVSGWHDTRVRVVPRTRALHPALRLPATLLTFEDPVTPVVYVETDAATVFHDDRPIVEAYREKLRRLDRLALGVEESRAVLARWATVHERQAA